MTNPAKRKIAIVGPQGSFSDCAFKKYRDEEPFYAKSLEDLIDAVKRGDAGFGFIPIKNSQAGDVAGAQEVLDESKFKILDKFEMPISYVLVVWRETAGLKIKKVFSHKQSFAQCKENLKKYVPDAELCEMTSTAAAMRKVEAEQSLDYAALGSKEAALRSGLPILKEGLEDQAYLNTTTFLLFTSAS